MNNIRNIGIIAHVDAGKTTTTERILFYSGLSHKIGEVHQGNTVTDWMKQEQERGITITSASVTIFWKTKYFNSQINIIDTPGHVDFTIEVERSLRILDSAVLIICASSGIQPQTETVWNQSVKFNIPKIIFINKIDRIGSDYFNVIKNLNKKFLSIFLITQINIGIEKDFSGIIDLISMKVFNNYNYKEIPLEFLEISKKYREKLLEIISENDDSFFEKYLNNNFNEEDIILSIRKLVIKNKIIPILCGSSLKNKGIELLLNSIVNFLPSPLDVFNKFSLPEKNIFIALLFKLQNDVNLGTLYFIRIYSGSISPGDFIYNNVRKNKEKVFRILRMFANNKKDLNIAHSGDIVAIVGFKNSFTGDTLCNINNDFVLEKINIPLPVISLSIEPVVKNDQEKLIIILNKLSREDPSLKIKNNSSTNELIISGMGELHLEIINDRINDEFNIKTKISKPQVYYKESIKKEIIQEGKYIKQTGGRGQYGHVVLKLEPVKDNNDIVYNNEIIGGAVPKEYFSCIEKAVFDQLKHGILTQNSLTKIKVTLLNGSFHSVDSSEYAFKNAVFIAIKEGLKKADPFVLEPIMKVEINLDNEFLGSVVSNINKKRGQIISVTDFQNFKVIKSLIPLKELFGYSTELRSITKGTATYNMEFNKYCEIPYYIFNNEKK